MFIRGNLRLQATPALPEWQGVSADTRLQVFKEVEKSKQPGYIPPSLDGEDLDFYDLASSGGSRMRLRPTGTTSR